MATVTRATKRESQRAQGGRSSIGCQHPASGASVKELAGNHASRGGGTARLRRRPLEGRYRSQLKLFLRSTWDTSRCGANKKTKRHRQIARFRKESFVHKRVLLVKGVWSKKKNLSENQSAPSTGGGRPRKREEGRKKEICTASI